MPKHYGNPGHNPGNSEVAATTRKKVVTKKAVPQQKKNTGLLQRVGLGTDVAEAAFKQRVKTEVGPESTQRDVLKAAGFTDAQIKAFLEKKEKEKKGGKK